MARCAPKQLGEAGAFLGGAYLAREEEGEPLVGGLVLATFPAFTGVLASGLTEDAACSIRADRRAMPGWRWSSLTAVMAPSNWG